MKKGNPFSVSLSFRHIHCGFTELGPDVRSCIGFQKGRYHRDVFLVQCRVKRRFPHISDGVYIDAVLYEK